MKKEKPKQQVQQVQVKEKKTSIKERLKSIKDDVLSLKTKKTKTKNEKPKKKAIIGAGSLFLVGDIRSHVNGSTSGR